MNSIQSHQATPKAGPHTALASSGTLPLHTASLTARSARGWGLAGCQRPLPTLPDNSPDRCFQATTPQPGRRAWSLSLMPSVHSCDPGPLTSHHPPSTLSLWVSAFPGGNEGHGNPSAVRRLEAAWEHPALPWKTWPLALGRCSGGGPGRRWGNNASPPTCPQPFRPWSGTKCLSPALWGQR